MLPKCEMKAGASTEHLLIDGYRAWSKGNSLQDARYWEHGWNLFAVALGEKDARLAMDALSGFVRILDKCAGCPLKTNILGSSGISRDEVLMLGLIAGLQHEDETSIMLCLNELSCPSRCSDVLTAAEILAVTFKSMDKKLRPIPALTLMAVMSEGISDYVVH